MDPRPHYLTYQEAADSLGVHVKTLKRWVHQGRLRPSRLGVTTVRFLPEDIQEFVERHKEAAG